MDILTDSHHVTRLDVVDTGRRRRWSEEAKLRIVEESFAGFRQASATARRHGISRQQIFSWRKAYREGRLSGAGGLASAGASATKERAPDGSVPAGFAPALIVPDAGSDGGRPEGGGGIPLCAPDGSCPSGSRATPLCAPSRTGRMEIVSANGRRVIVDGDVDAEALCRIIRMLETLPSIRHDTRGDGK